MQRPAELETAAEIVNRMAGPRPKSFTHTTVSGVLVYLFDH
jgi:hypothetical protein